MKLLMKGLLLAAALLLAVSTAQAAIDPAKVQKLLAGDGAAGDEFGRNVAVDGNIAVIGAHGNDGYKGSAYVFIRAADGTWSQEAKLIAADAAAGDNFGYSVAVDGNTAVIGAYGDDGFNGAAYVFVRAADGAWSQEAKLTAAGFGAQFGRSVSLSGGTAVIGASYDNGPDSDSGSAYVFIRAADGTWSQQAKLTAADAAAGDWFGNSVAVSGDMAVIGADGDDIAEAG